MNNRRALVAVYGLAIVFIGYIQAVPAHAEASLQVSPQRYEEVISGTAVRNGFVDVSNPSDTSVQLQSEVQGFRQANLAGDLEFFDDATLSAAIGVDLPTFVLGPRESIRVAFRVDPSLLPKGGVYAAIFFRTVPPPQSSATSYIAESAKVGTLLLLENGTGEHVGAITKFSLPLFQFGDGLRGTARYRNTDRNTTAAAFAPDLSTKVLFWGRNVALTGPYVLPQSEREFEVRRTGSYIGILPLSLRDSATGQVVTRWAIVCTGWYALGILILVMFGAILAVRRFIVRRRKPPVGYKRKFDGISQKGK